MDFYINKTPTGYTVVVDGVLRGARIPTQQKAEHLGKLLTDPEYANVYKYIQREPEIAIELVQKGHARREPHVYARKARQIQYFLSGKAQPKKGLNLESSHMTWEGAQVYAGSDWKHFLYSNISGLQKSLKDVEDKEALQLLRKMSKALTFEDREIYYDCLDQLMEWYGEIW